MASGCNELCIGSRPQVENISRVNNIPALKILILQCLLQTGKTSIPVIMLDHLSTVIDLVE